MEKFQGRTPDPPPSSEYYPKEGGWYATGVTQINVLVHEATDQHFHEASAFFPGHPACRKYQRCEDTTIDLVDPFTILPLLFKFIGGERHMTSEPDRRLSFGCVTRTSKKGILLLGPEATCSNVDTSLQRSIRRSSRQVFVTVGEQ